MSDSNSNFSILSTVPKLDSKGANWHLFKTLFANFMDGHVLERLYKPESYPAETYENVEPRPSKKDGEDESDLQKRVDVWEEGESKWKEETKSCRKDNAKARAALAKVLPTSVYIDISKHKHFYDMWKALETRFEGLTEHQKSNLKGRLYQMVCMEKDNVIAHLEEMESVYQQLASRNVLIPDEDYVDAIIRSLPQSYSTLVSSTVNINRKLKLPTTPAEIKDVARKEYEARLSTQSRGGRTRSNEIALHADAKGRGRGRGRGRGGLRGRGNSRGGGGGGDRGGNG